MVNGPVPIIHKHTRRDPWPLTLGRVRSTLFFETFLRVCTTQRPIADIHIHINTRPTTGSSRRRRRWTVINNNHFLTVDPTTTTNYSRDIKSADENIYCHFIAHERRTSGTYIVHASIVHGAPVNWRIGNNNNNNKSIWTNTDYEIGGGSSEHILQYLCTW